METIRDNAAYPPDRLNEDWRFGRPHEHAKRLLALINEQNGLAGELTTDNQAESAAITLNTTGATSDDFASIGSEYLVQQALNKKGYSICLNLSTSSSAEKPFLIRCEAKGFMLASMIIVVEPGVSAHIVEEHAHYGDSVLMCLRQYTVMPGASLTLELREKGSGKSSALNITRLNCVGNAQARCISTHKDHIWAREETSAELTPQGEDAPELLLLSANHLTGTQWLDQRTRQLHTGPGGRSRLLYKNVVDERATAIFGGNIRVEPGAHDTDAYLSNLNMTLSERSTVHSLPGLEILADRVRCSHGSATAPMDEEQLFYLLSRGIGNATARGMLAEGFLADVWHKFRSTAVQG